MSTPKLSHDEKWPRANSLFTVESMDAQCVVIGIPAHKTSLSPTAADQTPAAIREDLARYSTYSSAHNLDLRSISIADAGDVSNPDGPEGEARVATALSEFKDRENFVIALGGDNSITYSVAAGLFDDLSSIGVITLDAHHDLRDGVSNGSPIWRLIQAGVPGKNIVQIGISDFANSAEYSQRAKENGITVIHRHELRTVSMADAMKKALGIAGKGGRKIYIDLDVDVCDRSVTPACPASVPGGISADELRTAAFVAASDPRVRAIDITEIDATKDSDDRRTTRLAALLVLESLTGFATRAH